MKLNNDCTRKELLEIENLNIEESSTAIKLQEILKEYSIEEILNTLTILNKAHFIIMIGRASYDDSDIFKENKIKSLSERGFCR